MLLAALACVDPTPDGLPPAEKTAFSCELGTDGPDGFATLDALGTLELHMGFQGFLLFVVRARALEEAPALVDATVAATFDGEDRTSVVQPRVPFEDGAVTDEILVFITANWLSYYVGREAEVSLRAESEGAYCTATGTATMVDEDPCVHTGDEPLCPEDTGG
ncbi:MAG: hypothetical protein ACOZNI_29525 [Myxococcota bacterium]